ncbi:uncharacterized protein LOC105683572 [Athalia rosae]|uniref:uncharacterized protein LOC105683572 n=1 Tax=Athalia rosae TaxID=37344 RepID=UPI000625B9D3|nr:uncharacterized protein LOC105683572 [Athalia rosae]
MWRSSKKLMVDCFNFILRCGGHNLGVDDLEDIPEYDLHDVPVHFQAHTFGASIVPRQDDMHHRPDAPGFRRRSPPEIVTKVRLALEEMGEEKLPPKARGDHYIFECSAIQATSRENT